LLSSQTFKDNESGNYDTRYSVYDNVSIQKGRHTIKLGYSGIKLLQDGPATGLYFGGFNFSNTFTGPQVANAGVCDGRVCGDSFADFLLGLPLNTTRYSPRSVIARRKWEHGAFAQDDFRLNSKLTLTYGLRWVRYTVPYDKNKRPLLQL
jgi:outer membrane receptor protein involved in Fe transport